jgi:putative flavoprotein involved in K+ transport
MNKKEENSQWLSQAGGSLGSLCDGSSPAPAALAAAAEAWLSRFERALGAGGGQDDDEQEQVDSLFVEEGASWRDLTALSWNIVTVEGREGVAELAAATAAEAPTAFRLSKKVKPSQHGDVTTAFFEFETAKLTCEGIVRLVRGGTLAWTLLTAARAIKGHESVRPHGIEPTLWPQRRAEEAAGLRSGRLQPDVVIVGGGQSGIALGARLRHMGVRALVLERRDRPGDSWRCRYKTLHLHDPVWFDHLPILPFPNTWPVFMPKDQLGDWLEAYVQLMEVPYWSRSEVMSASFDETTGAWTVLVTCQEEENGGKEVRSLNPKHLVFATGASGFPNDPAFPGRESFRGEQHHSSAHPGADRYAGKNCVVVGSNNSSFDISAGLWEAGAATVTMVQRSSTCVIRSEDLVDQGLGALYSEEAIAERGVTTELADLIFASVPYSLMADMQRGMYDGFRKAQADYYKRLEDAGFLLDFGEDDSGLYMKYVRRASGYYIDVGAAKLVAQGSIKLARGQVDHLTETAVVLDDGTELPADLVVYATGYGPMNQWVAQLVSQEAADCVGKVWGMGSGTARDPGPWEGELRALWKPTASPGLWFMAGNMHMARHYSLFLALQLKARLEGIDTPVFGLPPVHHKQ